MDDQVDAAGEPISSAHRVIYEYIGKCRDDMIERYEGGVKVHEDERHHPPLAELARSLGKTPSELMTDFIGAVQVSTRIVDALDGPEVKRLDGRTVRVEEDGMIWQMKDMQNQLRNGVKHNVKYEVTKAQWAFGGTIVTALTAIAVALIANPPG